MRVPVPVPVLVLVARVRTVRSEDQEGVTVRAVMMMLVRPHAVPVRKRSVHTIKGTTPVYVGRTVITQK